MGRERRSDSRANREAILEVARARLKEAPELNMREVAARGGRQPLDALPPLPHSRVAERRPAERRTRGGSAGGRVSAVGATATAGDVEPFGQRTRGDRERSAAWPAEGASAGTAEGGAGHRVAAGTRAPARRSRDSSRPARAVASRRRRPFPRHLSRDRGRRARRSGRGGEGAVRLAHGATRPGPRGAGPFRCTRMPQLARGADARAGGRCSRWATR